MLWFKILFRLKILEPVQFLFSFVVDYGNESDRKENKKWTGLKNLKPKKNLNHNIYIEMMTDLQYLGVLYGRFPI